MKDKRYLLNSGLFLKLSAGARYKETRQTGSILKAEIIKDKRFLKLRGGTDFILQRLHQKELPRYCVTYQLNIGNTKSH